MSHRQPHHARHGITLLEVMISMGILTVGLASIAALIPAGRSQAIKATIYDRGATLASNAAADLINRGFLRTEALAPDPTTAHPRLLIYDPLFAGTWGQSPGVGDWFVNLRDDGATGAKLDPLKNLAVPAAELALTARDGLKPLPTTAADILFRSEDDPIYAIPADEPDATPLPGWSTLGTGSSNGRRGFDGTYSYLATLETGNAGLAPDYWRSGRSALMTVVVFHRRDPATPPFYLVPVIDPSSPSFGLWVDPNPIGSPVVLPEGDTIRDVVRPGSLVLSINTATGRSRWYRVLLATDQSSSGSGVQVGISCEGSDPPMDDDSNPLTPSPYQLYVLPGAVAGLQLPVTLEGQSKWNE